MRKLRIACSRKVRLRRWNKLIVTSMISRTMNYRSALPSRNTCHKKYLIISNLFKAILYKHQKYQTTQSWHNPTTPDKRYSPNLATKKTYSNWYRTARKINWQNPNKRSDNDRHYFDLIEFILMIEIDRNKINKFRYRKRNLS